MKPSLFGRLARMTVLVAAFAALPSLAASPLLVPYTGSVPKAEKKPFASQGNRVKLNVGALESLKTGEAVDFTVPGGKTYAVVFDSVEKKGGGVKSWVGYLRDTPDRLRVIVTTGPGGTFGTILTPDGEFQLVPGDGHDWLVDMKAENPPPVDLRKDILRVPNPPAPVKKLEPAGDAATGTGATAAATTTSPTAKTTPSQVTIDVMVAYSAGYAAHLGPNLNTRIAQLFTSANTYLADSQVGIRLRLVKTVQVNYSDSAAPNDNDTALTCITPVDNTGAAAPPCDPAFSNLETLRAQYGADLISFLRYNSADPFNEDFGGAGIAWAPNSALGPFWKPYMYSVVTGCAMGCDFVWAHELGHNMGNMHDRATVEWQAGGTATLGPFDVGATPYAYGYYACDAGPAALNCNPTIQNGLPGSCSDQPQCSTGISSSAPGAGTNNISDIMAYFQYSTTKNMKFSNPNLTCSGALGIGIPCGVSESLPNSANTALSMNQQSAAVSQMMPTMVPDVPGGKRKVDFNADGMGDLAWKNANTGAQGVWLMNGAAIADSGGVTNGSNVFIQQIGDYDGDGHSDLLWRNATDGSYSIQLMNGKAATATASILRGGSSWEVVDKGDFNGDGKTDLLWKDASGSYGIWLMNGSSPSSYGAVFYGGSGWTIKIVADFNGDGKSDLLGVNTDGSVRIWLMDGISGWAANTILPAGSTWQPVLAADFNGDGMADLLWRNSADGSYGIWLMSGMNIMSYGYVFYANNGITITHAVDLDGDGKADLVGTQADGSVRVWTMNGIAGTAAATLFAAGTGWTPVYSDDFNGDGKADLVLRNADGRYQLNLMNGTSVISSTQVLGPGTGWNLTP